MKVFKQRIRWGGDEQELHLVEDREWVSGGMQSLTAMIISTFCEKKYTLTKGDIYEPYVKDIHRKKLCAGCVRMINLHLRSLKTKSKQTNLGKEVTNEVHEGPVKT